MGPQEDTCLLARRGWYGMRDAGQAFEFAVRDHFLDHDFKQGMFSTCVFAHRSKFLLYCVHGDDYVGLGVRGDLEGYKAKLSERFIIKDRGILGADGLREIRILNSVITYHPAKPGCPEMLTYEADHRHADLLMAEYGLHVFEQGQANSLGQSKLPGSTSTGRTFLGWEATCRVPQQMHEMFWPSIDLTSSIQPRRSREPWHHQLFTPMKHSRLFHDIWRVIHVCCGDTHGRNGRGKVLGLTDSNWAACLVTRKSISATYLMLGKHPIFAASSTQTILSLSSGEAEFYGAVRCACRTLGWRVSRRTCHWMSRQNW